MMVAARPELHGRAAERARLDALLDVALGGGSRVLLLSGEPGMGKSALLAEAAEAAERAGVAVLRSRSVPDEGHVPFAALDQLLLGALDHLGAVPGPGGAALAVALGLQEGEPPAPAAVGAGLVALLAAVAEAGGGALVLADDAHWMDEASLHALSFALRRLRRDGVAAVLAARPDPDRGLFRLGFETLALAPLDLAAAARVAADAAAADGAPALARVVGLARGNPLALREMTAALTADQLAGAAPLPVPLPPSLLIDRAFRQQVDALAPATRAALVVLAAEEDELVERALEHAGLDPAELDAAEAAGLLVAEGAGRRFRHPLLRGVVYHGAPLAERRRAHEAWRAVAALDPIRRAWHQAATTAGPDAEAAAALEAAAGLAAARGGTGAAADAAARAAELTAEPRERARRLLLAAHHAVAAGRGPTAIAHAEAGLALAGEDDLLRAELAGLRAFVLLRVGEVEQAYATLLDHAARIEAEHPERAALALLVASVRDRLVGDYPAMRHLGERAAALAAQDAVLHGVARGVLAVTDVLEGAGDAARPVLRRLLPAATAEAVARRSGEFLLAPVHAAVWLGEHDLAGRVLEHRIARMRELGEVAELLYPLTIRAQLHLRRGRLSAALADATEAMQLAREAGLPGQVAVAGGALAAVEAVLGRGDACLRHGEEAIAIADDRSALGMWARAAIAAHHLAGGRPDAALPLLRDCARSADRIGMGEPAVIAFAGDLVEALARTGDHDGAQRALRERVDRGAGTAWRRGAVARGRGLLAEGDAAVAALEASVAAFEAGGLHLEAARSRLLLGERLRRDRRRLLAREPLQAALEALERMGARPWAVRAREELRATGQATGEAGRRAAGLDELTPHELRVALLVAAGRSNPQVAMELHVTRKTVEHHLSRVFRKLGVASRAELARLLPDGA